METVPFTFAFDDAQIAPVSPGAALARLIQLEGALQRHAELSAILPDETLVTARENLASALQNDDSEMVQNALTNAQNALGELYSLATQNAAAMDALDAWKFLRWPNPQLKDEAVLPIDVSTITVTHSRPQRQVFSTIAFSDAIGAMGYSLREIRTTDQGEEWEDTTAHAYAPVFCRVRMGAGTRRFRIESRNAHSNALSPEFSLEIPAR